MEITKITIRDDKSVSKRKLRSDNNLLLFGLYLMRGLSKTKAPNIGTSCVTLQSVDIASSRVESLEARLTASRALNTVRVSVGVRKVHNKRIILTVRVNACKARNQNSTDNTDTGLPGIAKLTTLNSPESILHTLCTAHCAQSVVICSQKQGRSLAER